jgi:hypothetical protein
MLIGRNTYGYRVTRDYTAAYKAHYTALQASGRATRSLSILCDNYRYRGLQRRYIGVLDKFLYMCLVVALLTILALIDTAT